MRDNSAHRAVIEPVSTAEPRPLWSVMIPAYNCSRYLADTLWSVLAQDPGPAAMQIEVVDDHSTDADLRQVVEAIGGDRVGLYRQARNLGITKNFETCLRRSRGRLVHLLHGDDCVRDGFYRTMQRVFEQHPDAGAAFCRHIFMDAEGQWLDISPLEQRQTGILDDWLSRLASEQRIMTPSMVVRREVYEELGGFDDRLVCSEDWEMWVRVAARHPIAYVIEPLAMYRMHDASNTGRHTRSAEDMRYTREAIDIFKSYLPAGVGATVTRRAKRTYALSALSGARAMLARRDFGGVMAQSREALRMSASPTVVAGVAGILLRAFLQVLRRPSPSPAAL